MQAFYCVCSSGRSVSSSGLSSQRLCVSSRRLYSSSWSLLGSRRSLSSRRSSSGSSGSSGSSSSQSASSVIQSRSFEAIGLTPELATVVHNLGFSHPSAPQALAVPPLLAGKSIAFASSTGSGKTLAYLLPLMQLLREQEVANPSLRQGVGCRPRALILAPTCDLTVQISEVAKAVARNFHVRVRTVESGTKLKDTLRKMDNGADIIVATADRLLMLHERGRVSLRQIRHVVVDEADDMLLRGFDQKLRAILRRCPPRHGDPPSPQLAFISATLGTNVRHVIERSYPDVTPIVANCAHRAPPKVEHDIVHVTGDKMLELKRQLALLTAAHKWPPRTLIFCRGVQSTRAVQQTLVEAGMAVGGQHGKMPDATRHADLADFVAEPPRKPLLVCSDITARGIDFTNVDHVINFDFPSTSALYLHRAGRTGRMGRRGTVISLVTTSEQRFAASIKLAVTERDVELHTVRKGDAAVRRGAQPRFASRQGARATLSSAMARSVLARRSHKVDGVAAVARGGPPRARRRTG